MGLFNRKSDLGSRPVWMASGAQPEIVPAQPEYESVLEWLVGLSDEDFDKVCKVAVIYRTSDKSASEVLGAEAKPTTFINPPSGNKPNMEMADQYQSRQTILDEDDELIAAFLEDDAKEQAAEQPAVDTVSKRKAKGGAK